jgi:catechol 2,3-dioxygenase-like lactoylglutathione lyase family enzyme
MTVLAHAVNHIGITVGDLDATLDWYNRVFGVSPMTSGDAEGTAFAESVGLGGVGRMRYAVLSIGGFSIEFIEHEQPRSAGGYALRQCDAGAVHICYEVDNLVESYYTMVKLGVDFITPPLTLDESYGRLKGTSYVYFRDPGGITYQLKARTKVASA